MDEFERLGEGLDFAKVSAFELGSVEGVQVVESPDGMAVLKQSFADMGADETGAAGDQKIHQKRRDQPRKLGGSQGSPYSAATGNPYDYCCQMTAIPAMKRR